MVLVQLRSASPQTSMIVYGLLCNVLQNDDDDFSIFSAFFKVMPPSKKLVATCKVGEGKIVLQPLCEAKFSSTDLCNVSVSRHTVSVVNCEYL